MSEDELKNEFLGFGEVASVDIIRDKATGRSRGFAFVELPPEADMAAVISQLNGKVLDGRPLTVNEAREPERRSSGGGYGGGRQRF